MMFNLSNKSLFILFASAVESLFVISAITNKGDLFTNEEAQKKSPLSIKEIDMLELLLENADMLVDQLFPLFLHNNELQAEFIDFFLSNDSPDTGREDMVDLFAALEKEFDEQMKLLSKNEVADSFKYSSVSAFDDACAKLIGDSSLRLGNKTIN